MDEGRRESGGEETGQHRTSKESGCREGKEEGRRGERREERTRFRFANELGLLIIKSSFGASRHNSA
jgi:hypothetical protein